MNLKVTQKCSKCGATSGDDWTQCGGVCPMPMSPHYAPQKLADEKAYNLLMEVVQLAKSGKNYKKLLSNLKLALQNSPTATDMYKVMIANLEGK